ncbi:MAG: hypothetical protein CM15mP84_04230 [Cellvibrionales bacterium]|nr:MAG: hypothetical protein CM15mP84_04230 [Cellvibrionales bacterium]
MAVYTEHGHACVQVLFVREARVLGSRSYYPQIRLDESPEAILEAFLPQFYLSGQQQMPQEIVTSHVMVDGALLEETLGAESGRKVVVKDKVRDARSRWLQMAAQNAQNNLRSFLAGRQTMAGRLESLRRALDLETIPTRMECLISATAREATWRLACIDGSGRESRIIASLISRISRPAMTMPRCSRRWSDDTNDWRMARGSYRTSYLSTAAKGR